MSPPQPPSGRITIVFTDIEDSSRMTRALGDDIYRERMRDPHCKRIREAIGAHSGYEVQTQGDAFKITFDLASDGLACAAAIQRSISKSPIEATDPNGTNWTIRVRIGVHTAVNALTPQSEGRIDAFDYQSSDMNFASRVASLGAGEQIIVSETTYGAVESCERLEWFKWPNRRIKSFDQPENVWELLWDGRSRGEPGSRWLPEWFMGDLNHYVARPELEAKVHGLFATPLPHGGTPRLVTLRGFGGMGKTRLAIACGIQAVGLFDKGVHFVRLDDRLPSKESVAEAIGAALGQIGELALPDKLAEFLRERNMLLVLDNFESVDCESTAGFIDQLLTTTRQLRLLVTGREAVKLTNVEQVIDFEDSANQMTVAEAEELFESRMKLAKDQYWTLKDEERSALGRILELTERIPLAIELAAAWSGRKSLSEIADGIAATPLGELTEVPPRSFRSGGIERHRSIRRCLDWSFNLLDSDTRDAFLRFSVFAASFDTETAAAVSGLSNSRNALERLLDASLVRRMEHSRYSRFVLNRFAHEYATEKLSQTPLSNEILSRFVHHYVRLARQNAEVVQTTKLAVLDIEWPNAIAAAAAAEQLGENANLCSISESLTRFFQFRKMTSEMEQLSLRALRAATLIHDTFGEDWARDNLGKVYDVQKRWMEAEAEHRLGLEICQKHGHRLKEAFSRNNLGCVYLHQGRLTDAADEFERALVIAKEIGDAGCELSVRHSLGNLFIIRDDLSEAETQLRKALQIACRINDRWKEEEVRINVGRVMLIGNRWSEAETQFLKALQIAQQQNHSVGEGHIRYQLGDLRASQNRWSEAAIEYRTALGIISDLEMRDLELQVRIELIWSLYMQDLWPEAEVEYRAALSRCRGFIDRKFEWNIRFRFVAVLNDQLRWSEEEVECRKLLQIAEELDDLTLELQSRVNLGGVFELLERWPEAEAEYHVVLAMSRQSAAHKGEGQMLIRLARLSKSRGDIKAAMDWARQAVQVLDSTDDDAQKTEVRGLFAEYEVDM